MLLSCREVEKAFGGRELFQGIDLHIKDGEKVGMIGPNGSGKTTLLKILAGLIEADSGQVSLQPGIKIGYVPQEEDFDEELTLEETLFQSLKGTSLEEYEKYTQIDIILTQMGFEEYEKKVGTLSGGWKKRLSLARALVLDPHILLLDEPTNHLDIEGVIWLEEWLKNCNLSFVLVTHDRYFLENVTNRLIEINSLYPDGFFSVQGNYSHFLEKREEFYRTLKNRQQALKSRVTRELDWLQQGPKARTTRANFRLQEAQRLQNELAEVEERLSESEKVDIDFSSTGRKTHQLLKIKKISKARGGETLFSKLTFVLTRGMKLGLLGPNGSGKSTLLQILTGDLEPDEGTIKEVRHLKIVYFSQEREELEPNQVLREALAPQKNQVIYQGRQIPVQVWAHKFLFRDDQLNTPVKDLSGGEQARLLIARLMLQPADVLLLDEPTNDLDIPSLQVLEESLNDFPGALVLVTHDRFLLDKVCNAVLGLAVEGGARFFADYSQWHRARKETIKAREERKRATEKKKEKKKSPPPKSTQSKGLNFREKQEWDSMEDKILEAEAELEKWQEKVKDPQVMEDHEKLRECYEKLDRAREKVESLYERWEELEAKK